MNREFELTGQSSTRVEDWLSESSIHIEDLSWTFGHFSMCGQLDTWTPLEIQIAVQLRAPKHVKLFCLLDLASLCQLDIQPNSVGGETVQLAPNPLERFHPLRCWGTRPV